jgi:hypothetical protein
MFSCKVWNRIMNRLGHFLNNKAVHPEIDITFQEVSRQVAPSRLIRGTRDFTAYCCSRQGLTGFTAVRCTGPAFQRPLPFPYLTILCLRPGIKPCCSGLQVQGTASSPSGTANLLTVFYYAPNKNNYLEAITAAVYAKYFFRTMHSLRSGPTPIMPTLTPVSFSMNSTYSFAPAGSSL